MANTNQLGRKEVLYLDDLHVGQRFINGTHSIDEGQIKAFAEQFDPQPFHLDAEAAKETLFEGLVASGWHTAAVSMRLLVEGVPIAAGLLGLAEKSAGQSRRDRALSSMSKAKSSKCDRHDRVRIAAWQRSAAKPAISSARSCRCLPRTSSCRAGLQPPP